MPLKHSQTETEGLSKEMMCKQDQIWNWYNNAKGKKKATVNIIINLADGSSAVVMSTGPAPKAKPVHTCTLTEGQVFQMLFYEELVKPLVDSEKAILHQATSVKANRQDSLSISQKHTKAVWKAASAEVQEAVKVRMVELKLEKEAVKVKAEAENKTAKREGEDVGIEDDSDVGKQVVLSAQYLQGDTKLEIHLRTDLNGHHFNKAYLLFNETMVGPFLEFSKDCIGTGLPTVQVLDSSISGTGRESESSTQVLVSGTSSTSREASKSSEATLTPLAVLSALSPSITTSAVVTASLNVANDAISPSCILAALSLSNVPTLNSSSQMSMWSLAPLFSLDSGWELLDFPSMLSMPTSTPSDPFDLSLGSGLPLDLQGLSPSLDTSLAFEQETPLPGLTNMRLPLSSLDVPLFHFQSDIATGNDLGQSKLGGSMSGQNWVHLGAVDMSHPEIDILELFRKDPDSGNSVPPFSNLENSPTHYIHKQHGNKCKSSSHIKKSAPNAAPSQVKWHKKQTTDSTPVDTDSGCSHCQNSGNHYRALINAQGASSLGATGKGMAKCK
ncbi:hypothetical protein GYMLUDRAFT_250872 [Collybiopsis luxurians FD-317 M1]|uniref:Uncharacterized protein n=1 Tax=Collybiopsis luxurians FD-317 M1 TaxID=944289 RepID=A0A0D0C4Z5_9AGAR|nr:hypothetical protein GYMLUDRAFT_250872 [Collybiopsis luxurians FD-317 M1]